MFNRRDVIASLGAVAALAAAARPANAQAPQGQSPVPTPQPRFGFEDVVRRARELAAVPYDPAALALPEPLARLDFDAWRDIRFRPERALFQQTPFQLQTFHPGFLHTRPVVVNVIREGVPAPIPYAANLFDYGRNRFERPLPVTTGFAGFRLHHPLNRPTYQDELISFLGASYFRFLGRSQQYGLSARGLAIGVGARETEEFPYFREFWVETPDAQADRAVVYALLDGESVTGAYQFLIYPGRETVLDITATVLARRSIGRLGVAPLTSMFFVGETERRAVDDFRPEMHDSDGLLIHSGSGEWIWRPLRNPRQTEVSSFLENNVRGFGLMQRDRIFEHYQDLDLAYERRPSYWVEPIDGWGEGRIELHEIPTSDETNDNIVALWTPREPMAAGQSRTFKYRLISTSDESRLTPGGIALNTFRTRARALGSAEAEAPNSTRFLVDFVGGQLPFFESAPDHVQVVPSASNGRVLRTFLVWNAKTRGFRAGIDVQVDPGQAADLRAFLRAGNKALTETWTYPWRPE